MRIRGLATSLLALLSIPLLAQPAAPPPPPAPAASAPVASVPTMAAFDVADVHASPYDRNLNLFSNMQGGGMNGDRYVLRARKP